MEFQNMVEIIGYKSKDKYGNVQVECICPQCGSEFITRESHIKSGNTKSCGCVKVKHGLYNHPLYAVWGNMVQRCTNPKNTKWEDYGGRGISICAEWRYNPSDFITWSIVNGWGDGLTIDRIDNDMGYSPENCRFVTKRLNLSNTRKQSSRTLPIGVCMHGTGFRAQANIDGKHYNLGTFRTEFEASSAYQEAISNMDKVMKK